MTVNVYGCESNRVLNTNKIALIVLCVEGIIFMCTQTHKCSLEFYVRTKLWRLLNSGMYWSMFWTDEDTFKSFLSTGVRWLYDVFQRLLQHRWQIKRINGTSLVAQRLRIRLPMQGTRVLALVREDPTCHGATKPTCHNHWACALEPVSHSYWACAPRARALQQEMPPQWATKTQCNQQ